MNCAIRRVVQNFSHKRKLNNILFKECRRIVSSKSGQTSSNEYEISINDAHQKRRIDNLRPKKSSATNNAEEFVEDEEDESYKDFTPFVVKKHPPEYFYKLCAKLANEGKIAECVAVVEKRMVEDRVRPVKFNYSVVIHALAATGQAKKAFQFFKKIRTAGYEPGVRIVTSVINACANASPSEADFAKRVALWLLDRERHLFPPPAAQIYFVTMKCFARHGDVETVFRLADDMIRDGYYPGDRVFNCLLSACISDKESGFKLALDVWKALRASKAKTSLYDFKLLLSACRDCGIGEQGNEMINRLVHIHQQNLLSPTSPSAIHANDKLKLLSGNFNDVRSDIDLVESLTPFLVKLDESFFKNSSMITCECTKFQMIGGLTTFIDEVDRLQVAPDVKLCSQLLYLVPNNLDSELILMNFARERSVHLDAEFFNQLIFRRTERQDLAGALESMQVMASLGISPTVRTFTGLCAACTNRDQALTLLHDMKKCGIKPTGDIFRRLITQAFNRDDFRYARSVITQMWKTNVRPTEKIIRDIEKKIDDTRKIILFKEKIRNKNDTGIDGYKEFLERYDLWTRNVDVLEPRDPKLTILNKEVKTDDVREDWEKPWVEDERKKVELEEMGKYQVVP